MISIAISIKTFAVGEKTFSVRKVFQEPLFIMSSQRKVLKRENLNYIDLLQQTIEHSEGQGDPLSEQIIEEDMGIDEYENEKKVDLDSFEVSVDNQYEISADARTGAKGDGKNN